MSNCICADVFFIFLLTKTLNTVIRFYTGTYRIYIYILDRSAYNYEINFITVNINIC